MEYRIIPMETYPRRAHFAYFSTMAQPYAGVTVSVEITHFLESVQEKGQPLSSSLSSTASPGRPIKFQSFGSEFGRVRL